jgi:putative glutamine amidotransferase
VALRLLGAAAERPELPVLASCRGMHELAVAAGARLSPVGDTAVRHRLAVGPDGPDRWAPAHPVAIRPGGMLADLVGPAAVGPAVNSAHSDQVTALPPGVRVEAVAPDGVVEAISLGWPARFVLGVQWHVEQGTERSDLDRRLLAAFGERCRAAVRAGVPG